MRGMTIAFDPSFTGESGGNVRYMASPDNKELMIIPDAVHTDLYDGGNKDYIPFDKLQSFFEEYLK